MHTQHMPQMLIVNRLEATKERFRPEGFDQIQPLFIRSLQYDQKVRPLSFRPEKFDLFTATCKYEWAEGTHSIFMIRCSFLRFFGAWCLYAY